MAVSSAATVSLALYFLFFCTSLALWLLFNLSWSSFKESLYMCRKLMFCPHCMSKRGDHSYACRYNLCNPQPASLAPIMDALLRAAASGEYGSDTRTDFLQAGLEHEKLLFVTSPFLDSNFSSNMRLEWQAQHSPILLSPDSIASML